MLFKRPSLTNAVGVGGAWLEALEQDVVDEG